jgi:hypothetical protein
MASRTGSLRGFEVRSNRVSPPRCEEGIEAGRPGEAEFRRSPEREPDRRFAVVVGGWRGIGSTTGGTPPVDCGLTEAFLR